MDEFKISPGTGIAYLDYNPNSDCTILLLHGLGADATSWSYQFPALIEAGFRVVAIDIPGFGKSPAPVKRWTINGVVVEISRLLNELNIGIITVAGISLGGAVALQLALDYPEMVRRLIPINTFASLRPRRMSELFYMLARFIIANIRGVEYQANLVAWRLFPQPEKEALRQEMIARILQANPKVYRQAMLAVGSFNVTARLKELRMPVLVISGANDTTVSLENQKALASGIQGARHVIIPEAGHGVIVDQPERFNEVMISFINEEKWQKLR